MKKRLIFFILAVLSVLVMTKGLAAFKYGSIWGHTLLNGLELIELDDEPARIWVEVHDVSPGYGVEKLMDITRVLDRHAQAVDKTVLFVIPNHEENTPISAYPEFTRALRELSGRGYVMGIHGYTHSGGMITPEFRTNLSRAERLIRAGEREFKEAGLERPTHFAPPGWHASSEVARFLRVRFDYTYYAFFIDTPNGTLPYSTNEYTWYDFNRGGLAEAKEDYMRSRGIFRLTIHLNAANTAENLKLLDQFLAWAEGRKLTQYSH